MLFQKNTNFIDDNFNYVVEVTYSIDVYIDNQVAANGIVSLIAGKLLAKAGFFALILKFWKIIAIAIVGAFTVFKKKIFGTKEEEA